MNGRRERGGEGDEMLEDLPEMTMSTITVGGATGYSSTWQQ